MGCGPSNSASVLEERVQEGIPSIPLDDSKLESLSNTPDHFSEQVDPPNGPPPVEVPKLVSPKLENGDVTNSFVDDIEGSPIVSDTNLPTLVENYDHMEADSLVEEAFSLSLLPSKENISNIEGFGEIENTLNTKIENITEIPNSISDEIKSVDDSIMKEMKNATNEADSKLDQAFSSSLFASKENISNVKGFGEIENTVNTKIENIAELPNSCSDEIKNVDDSIMQKMKNAANDKVNNIKNLAVGKMEGVKKDMLNFNFGGDKQMPSTSAAT